MDILGGKGIMRGPSNLLAVAYRHAPIAITVEGANILTRALIIFGQGAVRCHPCVHEEMLAVEAGDATRPGRALIGHARHVLRNLGASLFGAPLTGQPPEGLHREARLITRAAVRVQLHAAVRTLRALAYLHAADRVIQVDAFPPPSPSPTQHGEEQVSLR